MGPRGRPGAVARRRQGGPVVRSALGVRAALLQVAECPGLSQDGDSHSSTTEGWNGGGGAIRGNPEGRLGCITLGSPPPPIPKVWARAREGSVKMGSSPA